MLFQNKNMKLMIEQINLFLTYLHSCNLFKDSAPFFKSIKKAPNFRCFFPLFTQFHGVFACVSHIDKITAHVFFRTPSFHSHTVFCSLCATQSTQSVWYIIKKHQSQVKFVSDYFFFFI